MYTLILAITMFLIGIFVGHSLNQEDRLSDSSLRDALKREWQRKLDGAANEWD